MIAFQLTPQYRATNAAVVFIKEIVENSEGEIPIVVLGCTRFVRQIVSIHVVQ